MLKLFKSHFFFQITMNEKHSKRDILSEKNLMQNKEYSEKKLNKNEIFFREKKRIYSWKNSLIIINSSSGSFPIPIKRKK